MNITGLNKATVLAALYNRAQPQGMGFLQYDPAPWTEVEAQAYIDTYGLDFDYVKGRVMKIDLSEDDVYTSGYNRDNGAGAAEEVIAAFEVTGSVNATAGKHTQAVENQKDIVAGYLNIPTKSYVQNGVQTFELGMDSETSARLAKILAKV